MNAKLFLVLFFFLPSLLFAQSPDSLKVLYTPDSLINKPAPYFSGKSIKGTVFSSENFKGKVTLLNFWFISCMPCMHEIPYLNKIHKDYSGKDFQIISVANNARKDLMSFNDTTKPDGLTYLRRSLKTETINYEIIPACEKRKKRKAIKDTTVIGQECDYITSDYFIHLYPTTFIIDKRGIVRYLHPGFAMSDEYALKQTEEYRQVISKLLSDSEF